MAAEIPTTLNLVTPQNQFIKLKEGKFKLVRQNESLFSLDIQSNQFVIPQQQTPGDYAFEGEGVIESLQAVPIGGSQGGAVPIGGSQGGAVPISGSQGGFQAPLPYKVLQAAPEYQPGQRISFKGAIPADISQALESLALNVPANNITIIQGNQNTGNGVQLINTGTTGNININIGGSQSQNNRPPVIEALTANPTQTVKAGDVISFTLKAFDPDKDALDYTWGTVRGFLSTNKGTLVTWKPMKPDGTPEEPGLAIVSVSVSDNEGGTVKADINIEIQEQGIAQVSGGLIQVGGQ